MSAARSLPAAVVLRGDDPALLARAVRERVDALAGGTDHALTVTEFDVELEDLGMVVDAARTPPFLADRRIVVVRAADRFVARRGGAGAGGDDAGPDGDADAAASPAAPAARSRSKGAPDPYGPLVAYLADPEPTSVVVLEWTGGRVPAALAKALEAAGAETEDRSAPRAARARSAWLDGELRRHGLRLDAAATEAVAERLGDDTAGLAPLADLLASTYGTGQRLGVAEVAPYLGDHGDVAPWTLTDAIDRGDTAGALATLHRMLDGGGRHPLAVLAILGGHYRKVLRLDGAGVADEASAAALLGLKGSTFPARKALDLARRLGPAGTARAIQLLADADLALRGASGWADELRGTLALEILVARLSRLAPPARSRRR